MAMRKSASNTTRHAKGKQKSAKKGITAEFIRSLPKWKPSLTQEQVHELEQRHVSSGDLAVDRRITLAMSTKTQDEMVASIRSDIAEDEEAKTIFELLDAIDRCEKAAKGLHELAKSTSTRVLGAMIFVDDEDAKAKGRPPISY